MKDDANVKRAEEAKAEFERIIWKNRRQKEEEGEGKKRRTETGQEADEEAVADAEVEDETDERMKGMKEDATCGARGREGDDEEGEAKKRVRIAGVEAKEALKKIEVWVNEARLENKNAETEAERYLATAWDDVKSGELNVDDVKMARADEIGYMERRGIWEVVPISECWRQTGKPPIRSRWADTNKGSVEVPDLRCRLVARDFTGKHDRDREDLFAATPPNEAESLALSRAATASWTKSGRRKKRKIIFIDAKRAHLKLRCLVDVFVELPEEAHGGPGECAELFRRLYGCKPAV